MGGRCMPQTVVAMLMGVGAVGLESSACAGDPAGFVPRAPGAQLMLYLSRPLGAARGTAAMTYGIRYERATPVSTDPNAQYFAPFRHRSIVELQFARGTAPRMQFGPRVTWDLGRGQLAPTSLANAVWPMAIQPLTGAFLAAWRPLGPEER